MSENSGDHGFELRLLEAMLFAATAPMEETTLRARLPDGTDLGALLDELAAAYAARGVNLVRLGGRWAFRTAEDLAPHLRVEIQVPRKLSRAAVETLAIVAYHQPVTRGEVEEIRGVAVSKGTFDVLMDAGWVRPVGRRQTPGRPVTWGTTRGFLEHFGLASLDALPGIEELKAAGLLDTRPAATILGETAPAFEAAEDTPEDEPAEPLDPDGDEPWPEAEEIDETQRR